MSTISEENYEDYLNKAEDITKELGILRKKVFANCKEKFPELKYKTFTGLSSGLRANNLDKKVVDYIRKDINYINEKKEEIIFLKEKAIKIIDTISIEYRKRVTKLNPLTDTIPKGEYPKLMNCEIYPKRQSCNHGETENTDWDRCEYMKYDNSKSIYDSDRWQCTYKL